MQWVWNLPDSVAEVMCVDGALALSSEPVLAYKTLLRLFCKVHHESWATVITAN